MTSFDHSAAPGERRIFYGSFICPDIMARGGLYPERVQVARLNGFTIRIDLSRSPAGCGPRPRVPALVLGAPGEFQVGECSRVKGRNQIVYAVVRRVPRGRVATYGQIAALSGLGGLARQVGYALHALPKDTSVPWHRVVNARGGISQRAVPGAECEQRIRLELEGIRFNAAGRVPLVCYAWSGCLDTA